MTKNTRNLSISPHPLEVSHLSLRMIIKRFFHNIYLRLEFGLHETLLLLPLIAREGLLRESDKTS